MNSIKLKPKLEQKGAVLVMALLILSAMMTSAVALSRIILGEVRMTVNTRNSMTAFYAADSAIEKGLYYLKFARKYGDADPLYNMEKKGFNIDGLRHRFYYQDIVTSTPSFSALKVSTSTPASVDILDPAGELSSIDWDPNTDVGDTYYYVLDWSIENCFPDHVSDRIEITTYSFDSNFNTQTEKDIAICNCGLNDADSCDENLTQKDIVDTKYYRFSFRPLNTTAEDISFNIYKRDGSPTDPLVGIISNMSIIADGIYRNASLRMQVDTPTYGSLSDIFSYVVFSEEEIIKDL